LTLIFHGKTSASIGRDGSISTRPLPQRVN
jgi:hypothetical protein